MRTVIWSRKYNDDDLLRTGARNFMNNLYEFLGIYQEYLKDDADGREFEEYYRDYRDTTEYHFVNKGVQFTSDLLMNKEIEVSNRNIKRLGRTYEGFPVALSIYADKVIESILEYIDNDEMLKEVYLHQVVWSDNSEQNLTFQYQLLERVVVRTERGFPYVRLMDNINAVRWEERNVFL